MANNNLEKCPQLIQKTKLANICVQTQMAEAHMEFMRHIIKQNFDAEFLHDSVIIKKKKDNKNAIKIE